MSETRSYVSADNILHVADVAIRRPQVNPWRYALFVLLAIPVLVGLIDVVSRVAALLEPVQTTSQLASVAPDATSTPVLSASQIGIVPARLQIPSIGVDAHVEKVGLNSSGAMQAPSNFTDVGWYGSGSAPGAPGSAVIDGHVNNALTKAGVFENLDQVRAGDIIEITGANGERRAFQVESVKVYPVDGAPETEIFSQAGPSQLVLITCDGVWNDAEHQFSNRLVVYAKAASTG